MNDQTPSYGTPPGPTPVSRPATPGASTPGDRVDGPQRTTPERAATLSVPPRSPVDVLLTPRSSRRVPEVRVPGALPGAASILRGLGAIGVIFGGIGTVVAALAMASSFVLETSGDVLAAAVFALVVSLVLGVGLSVALLVQAPRVRDGDVRACRVAVVLLGITVGLRALNLFPLTLGFGTLVDLGLAGLAIAAIVKLRSDDARTYYAMATRQAASER